MEGNNQREKIDLIQPPWDSSSGDESTYWESNLNKQQQFRAESPQNERPIFETAEQFYEYYEKKMKDQNPIPDVHTSEEPIKKKKSSGKVFTSVIIILILIGIGTAAFAFRNTLFNSFALLTKKTVNYYSFVEKNNLTSATNLMKQLNINENIARHTSVEFTLNRNYTDTLLKKYTQTGLNRIESEFGISLKSFGLDAYATKQNKQTYEKLGLNINKIDVISVEEYIDSNQTKIRLPQLSPAYLKMTQSDDDADVGVLFSSGPSDSKKLADLIGRYGNIVFDQIKNVSLDRMSKLTRGDRTVSCSKLTATITGKDQIAIETAILKYAKTDDYIIDMLPSLHMTKAEYIKLINKLLADLKNDKTASNRMDIKMTVYVDRSGKIIARDLEQTKNGIKYTMDFTFKNDVQKCKMDVIFDGSSVVTIDTIAEQMKDYKIPEISASDKVYDSKDTSSYLKTINKEKYINELSKKLGMKKEVLNDLLGSFE